MGTLCDCCARKLEGNEQTYEVCDSCFDDLVEGREAKHHGETEGEEANV